MESMESLWSPGTGTPGNPRYSTRTPPGLQVHFSCVTGISKCTWSPGGVLVESLWSTRSPQESTPNMWGSVKTSTPMQPGDL
jgi:hypothetical protein